MLKVGIFFTEFDEKNLSLKNFSKLDIVFLYTKNKKNAVKASLTQFINTDILPHEPYLIDC